MEIYYTNLGIQKEYEEIRCQMSFADKIMNIVSTCVFIKYISDFKVVQKYIPPKN